MAAVSWHGKRIAPVLACGLALAAGGCDLGGGSSGRESRSASRGGTIRGAGATLAVPLHRQWAQGFRAREGTEVRYLPIGLSRGVSEFTATLIDFATIDAPLNDVEIRTAAADKSRPVHIPVAVGAVALAYRVRGARDGLRLDGSTVAAIFLGRVTRWNAPAIRRLNPGRALPAKPIDVVHRADSTGTTQLFTSYLAASSGEWSRRLGADDAVAWPVGRGAESNAAAVEAVARTDGAIGYVDAGSPRSAGVSHAALRNPAGQFVAPAPATIAAAARGVAGVPQDLRFLSVASSSDPVAYPITSPIFMLVYRDPCSVKIQPDNARRLSRWLRFVLGPTGQRLAATTPGFGPLAPDIAARARTATRRLTCDGKRL